MTGESVDVNDAKWSPGKPSNNGRGVHNCIQTNWREDQWNNADCNDEKDFACEVFTALLLFSFSLVIVIAVDIVALFL